MSSPTPRIDPQKMSPEDASRLLTRIGGRPVSKDMIRADIERGAANESRWVGQFGRLRSVAGSTAGGRRVPWRLIHETCVRANCAAC
jgi:hypothetical protein